MRVTHQVAEHAASVVAAVSVSPYSHDTPSSSSSESQGGWRCRSRQQCRTSYNGVGLDFSTQRRRLLRVASGHRGALQSFWSNKRFLIAFSIPSNVNFDR